MNSSLTTTLTAALFCTALGAASSHALAHGNDDHGKKPAKISTEQHDWGKQAHPSKAKRTVTIELRDTMRFSPDNITVKQGETVKFVFKNVGKTVHEWVLGTPDELAKHAEAMKKFPDMEHDAPYMVHVKPDSKGELAWTFNKAGTFAFGCLLPGHFEAGMKGSVIVASSSTKKG